MQTQAVTDESDTLAWFELSTLPMVDARDLKKLKKRKTNNSKKKKCFVCVPLLTVYNLNKSHLNTYDVLVLSELVLWYPHTLCSLAEVE